MNLSHYIQWRSNAEFKRFINSVDDRSYHANDDEFIEYEPKRTSKSISNEE